MSIELTTVLMLATLIISILLDFPIAFSLSGVATIFGFIFLGPAISKIFVLNLYGTFSNYVFIAVPLFIFMGLIIERSGIASRLYDSLFVLFGRLKGGLGVATLVTCTIFAAATGVVGASVVTVGLMALPAMMRYNYNKELATGSICAGGALGILIPPSILILVYAPTANISVGALLLGAFIPGFILSSLYIAYVLIRCNLNGDMGPAIAEEELVKYTMRDKIKMFSTSVLPVVGLVIAVLGSIFLGLAAPTEAAALGAFASVILALLYKELTWEKLKEAGVKTITISAMVYGVVIGAKFFTTIFMRLGCGNVVENVILGLPFGRWGILITMWVIIGIMGCFIDWVGIVMIVVPLFTPIAVELGFNPVWFALMNIIVLQTGFLTPPFAYTIFYLDGIAPPEIKLGNIYRGVVPFLLLILIGLVIFAIFPEILLWAPRIAGLL